MGNLFPPSGDAFLPWLTIPFSALASIHFFRRAFDSSPRLSADEEGITDRTAFLGREIQIPWEEVNHIAVSKLNGVVEVHVKDLKGLGKHASPGRRVDLWIRRLRGKQNVDIGPTMLGMRHEEIARRLEEALFNFERRKLGLVQSQPEAIEPVGGQEERADEPSA